MEDTDDVVGGFLSLQIEEASVWVGKQERRPPVLRGSEGRNHSSVRLQEVFHSGPEEAAAKEGLSVPTDGMEKPPYRTVPE